MNSLLMILFLGASVALAELSFEDPTFAEFLDDEGEEIMGELADEENDPHRHHHHRPSGRPPKPSPTGFKLECLKKLKECSQSSDGACEKLECFESFFECMNSNMSSPRPSLSPRKKFCNERAKKCFEDAEDDCKKMLKCLFCRRMCLKKRHSPHCPRPSFIPSFRPSFRPTSGTTRGARRPIPMADALD